MRTRTSVALFVATMLVAVVLMPVPVGAQAPEAGDRGPVTVVSGPPPAPVREAKPDAPELREWFGGGRPWREWSRMTGDWGAWRTNLEARGVTVDLNHVGDASGLVTGPAGSRTTGRVLSTVGFTLDLGVLAGLPGGRVLVQYQRKGGGLGSDCLDEGQGFSNIDTDDFGHMGEVWFEQQVGSRLRLKVGRIDANTEFAFVDNGGEFINASMGYTPTIFLFPTYPDPHAGIVIQATPSPHVYVGAGAFNGGPALGQADFTDIFAIGEAGVRWSRGGGGRLGVGYWRSSGTMPAADDSGERLAAQGHYAVFDQTVWSAGGDADPRSVALFAQIGLSNARVSPIARHLGGGVVATGLVPARPLDAVGIGMSAVTFGQDGASDRAAPRELNVGGFYKVVLSGWLALKPDLQFILHPAGAGTRVVTVGTLRVEVGF